MGIYFFLEIEKVDIFSRKSVFLCSIAFITLLQSSIGYVFSDSEAKMFNSKNTNGSKI